MRALLLIAALSLAGCAMPLPVFKGPAGATNEDLQRQYSKCLAQSAVLPTNSDQTLFSAALQGQYVTNCMRAEGYIKQN